PSVLQGSDPRDPSSALLGLVVFLSSALYLLAYVGGGFLFLFWLARANQNARALGSKNMEFTPGWMVGWFFVPVLNLFKPYEAVDELYLASDPTSGEDDWGASDPPRFILAWWVSWLFFGIGGSLAHFLGGQTAWALVPNFAGPVAAALAIGVVLSIDRRQNEKRKRSASGPSNPSTQRFY
ncbi:MAG TPA: DUF4328 domain-containing protein, partial [Vicinamibacteria bacterium]|nr:DUF4328 domain-containing protein [Vicinamibacteria bacterium]